MPRMVKMCDFMGWGNHLKINGLIKCKPESWSGRGVQHYVIMFVTCQWIATGRWFSPGHPVSPTNKTHQHDIAEILMKVALNTINQTHKHISSSFSEFKSRYYF